MRLPKEKYLKKILLESEVKKLQLFFNEHKNIRLTAREFLVSRTTVKYHTDPDFKEKANKYRAKRLYDKYHSDTGYREAVISRTVKNSKTFKERHNI